MSESKSKNRSEKSSDDDSDEPSRLHFTKVWLAALKLGYSRQELASMSYGEIIFDLAALNEDREAAQNKSEQEPGVVDATQEDIRAMLG